MKDSSVILEIPPATTIAYGVIELFIKHNGQFGKWKNSFFVAHSSTVDKAVCQTVIFVCFPVR